MISNPRRDAALLHLLDYLGVSEAHVALPGGCTCLHHEFLQIVKEQAAPIMDEMGAVAWWDLHEADLDTVAEAIIELGHNEYLGTVGDMIDGNLTCYSGENCADGYPMRSVEDAMDDRLHEQLGERMPKPITFSEPAGMWG